MSKNSIGIALVNHSRCGVAVHDRANVAGLQPALGDIARQDHVSVYVEGHAYLGCIY